MQSSLISEQIAIRSKVLLRKNVFLFNCHPILSPSLLTTSLNGRNWKTKTRLQFSSRLQRRIFHFSFWFIKRSKLKGEMRTKMKTEPKRTLCGIKNVHYWSAKRKWNSTTEHKISFGNSLDSSFPYIHHIQLLRLFNQKSPFFRNKKESAKKRVSSHHRQRRRRMPNHRLGCGYVDGRGWCYYNFHQDAFFFPSCSRGEENCVHFGHSLDIFFSLVYLVISFLHFVSECFCCSDAKVAARRWKQV